MKVSSILLSVLILFSSCMSTTMIQTQPPGADIYIDGVKTGKTPQRMTNDKTILECTKIKMEKEGYETLNTEICRNEEVDPGPIIAGLLVWFPFLWAMKYHPEHFYVLQESQSEQKNIIEDKPENNKEQKKSIDTKTKYELLRELKQLFDDGVITKEEYEKEKKGLLEPK